MYNNIQYNHERIVGAQRKTRKNEKNEKYTNERNFCKAEIKEEKGIKEMIIRKTS